VEIHDWIISALVLIHDNVRVQSNDEEITVLFGFFEEIKMTDMEQIKSTGDVDNSITGFWSFAITKLINFLCGRKELTASRPWTTCCVILSKLWGFFSGKNFAFLE
jgi:hypothetical protein